MGRRAAVAMFVALVSLAPWSVPQAAAQTDAPLVIDGIVGPISAMTATMQVAAVDQALAPAPRPAIGRPRRSWTTPVVIALHATTALSQALDVHSTMVALDRGAVEANPLMAGIVKNKAAFIGVKAAMGAGFAYATHRMARRNKVGAIVTAAAVNSAFLMVAHHNYRIARALR